MIENSKRELIALQVIKTLKTRFDNFPEDFSDNRNAPFHEAFLEAFSEKLDGLVTSIPVFISLSSWMHGLNTTLGQSFFENVAHILSDGEKRKFENLLISQNQQTKIIDIITELTNGTRKPDSLLETREIYSESQILDKRASDFSADVFFEDESQLVAIELKTVKPNKGIFKEEKLKMLNGKASLKNMYPDKEIKYFLGFPFDPLSEEPTGYNKTDFMSYSVGFKKYFNPDEILLADELWSYLSGKENTMEEIIRIINSIATPEFLDDYNFINDVKNIDIDKERFVALLKKWNLNMEIKIIEHFGELKEIIKKQKNMFRVLNQNMFKSDGKYNYRRFERLNALIGVN